MLFPDYMYIQASVMLQFNENDCNIIRINFIGFMFEHNESISGSIIEIKLGN